MMDLVPHRVFLTKGIGIHKEKLSSFELALRSAGIEKCNLVNVSSILPPKCKIISNAAGLKLLRPGMITYCVLARNETNEPNRLIACSIGIAKPANEENYGYLSEHHSFGETARIAGEYAEDLAATMLASTFGIPFDPDQNWDERKNVYRASGRIIKTRHICQSAEGNKNGFWTTVLSAAVFIMDEL
jgi:arginine decarboxylase